MDAIFEAVSGMTTTGSTVLSGLDSLPPGILLWRSLLQWTGGIGIIVMAIAILPFLRVGGMQLYATTDYSQWGTLAAVVFFYLTFSGACAGSTTGGIKMLRVGVMLETFRVYLRRLVYPSGTFIPHFNGREIEIDAMASVMVFVLAFAGSIAGAAMVLGASALISSPA